MKAYEIVAANGETFGPYISRATEVNGRWVRRQVTYEELLAMAEQWDQDEPDAAPHIVIEVER